MKIASGGGRRGGGGKAARLCRGKKLSAGCGGGERVGTESEDIDDDAERNIHPRETSIIKDI